MSSDIYSDVNDSILAALEQGIIPWKRPWNGRLPTNYDTGRTYRGVNILTLGIAEMIHGYSSPFWLTFRQSQKHGGHIRKGEKATYIVFSERKVKEIQKEEGRRRKKDSILFGPSRSSIGNRPKASREKRQGQP
jgi:antirestriction protein ArdC